MVKRTLYKIFTGRVFLIPVADLLNIKDVGDLPTLLGYRAGNDFQPTKCSMGLIRFQIVKGLRALTQSNTNQEKVGMLEANNGE